MKIAWILFGGLMIGSLMYLMIPRVMGTPAPSDLQLAVTRVEGCNLGVAALIQDAGGREAANKMWLQASNDEEKYQLLRDYLSFAPSTFDSFQEEHYRISLPTDLIDPKKSKLFSIQKDRYLEY